MTRGLTQRVRVLVVVLAFGALLSFVFTRVAARGRFTGEYSSYGSGPSGSRALYLLAEQLGANPARHSQDIAALPAHALLVALGGCDASMARPLSRYENDELVKWVAGGGVLLVAGARNYLPEGLGVGFDHESDCDSGFKLWAKKEKDDDSSGMPPLPISSEPEPADAGADAGAEPATDAGVDSGIVVSDGGVKTITAVLPSPHVPTKTINGTRWAIALAEPLTGLPVIALRKPGRIHIDHAKKREVLLGALSESDDHVRELGVVVHHGQGSVIVLASASPFRNDELHGSEGGPLFMRLLQRYAPHGPVLFDEFHLGVGERRSLMLYLRQAGVMPFVLGVLACAMLWLLRAGARFGGVRGEAVRAPSGTASFVSAMGRLYSGASDPNGAIDAVARRALARIAAHHHLNSVPLPKLELALIERKQPAAAQAVREIADAQAESRSERTKLPLLIARIDSALSRALR